MTKIEILYNDYNDLKNAYLKTKSLNLKEGLKSKLIELDYEISKDYEEVLNNKFAMTTTLEKEELRLEEMIAFVQSKKEEQNKLVEDYKKVTGLTIELSYLKYSDKLIEYRKRLDLVRTFLTIKRDLIKILEVNKDVNSVKVTVLKNRLMKKDMLSLLYEFCLIDNLDVQDIDVEKIVKEKKEMPKLEENIKIEEKKEEIKPIPVIQNIVKEEVKQEPVRQEEDKEELLSIMPKIEKLGTVTPVNVFESLKKTKEKLPDVVIPSNGLSDDVNDIFVNTNEYFN